MLIRLVLRQGDALRILALNTSLVLWLWTGLPAEVPEAMFTAAQKWKKLRAGEVKAPLRHILWICLLTELEARTDPAKLTEKTKTHLTKMGFIKDGQWLYLKWSFEENKLLTDTARSPIFLKDAHQQVKDLLRMSQDPQVITRFHPTRPLAPELKSPTVTFMSGPTGGGQSTIDYPDAGRIHASPTSNTATPPHLSPLHGMDQQHILRAKLVNSGNTCYTNAFILAILWTACRSGQPSLPTGLMRTLSSALKERKPLNIWRLLLWRNLMRQWSEPNRQHDAAELIAFLQDKGFAEYYEGHWQRRVLVEGRVSIEEAGSTMPLLLSVPLSAHCTPQALLDQWHAQAGFAGLLTAPSHLIVQLNRFGIEEESLQKSSCPVDIAST